MEKEEVKPVSAIVLYERGYCEFHDILSTEKNFMLGPGKPVSQDFLVSLKPYTEGIKMVEENAELFPENILYVKTGFGNRRIIWWEKASIEYLLFSEEKFSRKEGFIPTRIFDLDGEELKVFLIKGSLRPTEESVLYEAPFYNTSKDGAVCMGSADFNVAGLSVADAVKTIHRRFWGSKFSHTGSATAKIPIEDLWDKLMTGTSSFDMKWLNKSKTETLKDLIDEE